MGKRCQIRRRDTTQAQTPGGLLNYRITANFIPAQKLPVDYIVLVIYFTCHLSNKLILYGISILFAIPPRKQALLPLLLPFLFSFSTTTTTTRARGAENTQGRTNCDCLAVFFFLLLCALLSLTYCARCVDKTAAVLLNAKGSTHQGRYPIFSHDASFHFSFHHHHFSSRYSIQSTAKK